MEHEEHKGTGDQPQGDVVTSEVKAGTRTIKLRVTDIDWLNDEKVNDESPAAALSRIREELRDLRAERIVTDAKIAALLEQLPKSPTTEIVSSNANLSDFGGAALRDTMAVVKGACEDEQVCMKTALHMLDTKAAMVSKQLDRDHADEQKRLDRDAAAKVHSDEMELKNKDLEQKDKRLTHEKQMALIKKGVVPQDLLDGMVFLGDHKPKKTAHQILAEKQTQAYRTANADGDNEWNPDGDDLADVDT